MSGVAFLAILVACRTQTPAVPSVPDEISMTIDGLCARAGSRISCVPVEPYTDLSSYIVPTGEYQRLSTLRYSSCALQTTGGAKCWGKENSPFGEVFNPPAGPFRSVHSMGYGACAQRGTRQLECWGENELAGSPLTGDFVQAVPSDHGVCALTSAGRLQCVGGLNVMPEAWNEIEFDAIGGYGSGVCGISNGKVHCFGRIWDFEGQGYDTLTDAAGVVMGVDGICVLRKSGEAVCYGESNFGLLEVPAGPFVQIAAGNRSVCGLRASGTISCWGCIEDSSCPADFVWKDGSLERVSPFGP